MKAGAATPDWRAASQDYLLNRNCMKRPEVRQKVSEALRGRFCGSRGGNGHGLTVPQQRLLETLGDGWVAEFIVFSNGFRDDWPLMIVDIAHPVSKVAVEVNGNSHNTLKVKARDKKKKEILEGLGWTVFSFKNKAVLDNTQEIIDFLTA